jgi:hypothetical protein
VLIDFERVCYVSLQRFEKAVNLSFQNQLTCEERIRRKKTKKFLKTLTSLPTGQYNDEFS